MIDYLRDRYENLELYLAVRVWILMVKTEERRRGRRAVGGLRKRRGRWELDLCNVVLGSAVEDFWEISERGTLGEIFYVVAAKEEGELLPSTFWYDTHKPTRTTA